jgi:hypothetical protein
VSLIAHNKSRQLAHTLVRYGAPGALQYLQHCCCMACLVIDGCPCSIIVIIIIVIIIIVTITIVIITIVIVIVIIIIVVIIIVIITIVVIIIVIIIIVIIIVVIIVVIIIIADCNGVHASRHACAGERCVHRVTHASRSRSGGRKCTAPQQQVHVRRYQKCPLVLLPVLHTKVRHLDRQRQQAKV